MKVLMFPFAIPWKAGGIQSIQFNFIIFELCRQNYSTVIVDCLWISHRTR